MLPRMIVFGASDHPVASEIAAKTVLTACLAVFRSSPTAAGCARPEDKEGIAQLRKQGLAIRVG